MSLKDDEDALFAEWKERRGDIFVRDGVVDEQSYLGSNPKILFVLKEVNDLKSGGWDLRELLRGHYEKGVPWQTWNNVTRWTRGLRNLDKELPWSSLDAIDEPQRKEVLQSICAVNIKKTPGAGTADENELAHIAAEDEQFLKKQFALYSPNLVICCGQEAALSYHKCQGEDAAWQTTSRDLKYWRSSSGGSVIRFVHPQAHKSSRDLYYDLINAVKEITQARAATANAAN